MIKVHSDWNKVKEKEAETKGNKKEKIDEDLTLGKTTKKTDGCSVAYTIHSGPFTDCGQTQNGVFLLMVLAHTWHRE